MKTNKLYITVLFAIIMIGVVSAMQCDGTFLGTFKNGTEINLRQTCDTCTYVTLNTLTYPNSTILNIDENMTKYGIDYSFPYTITSLGDYYYSVFGDKNGDIASENFCFEVNPTGTQASLTTIILLVFILGIILIFLVYMVRGIFKAEEGWGQIAYICLSYTLLFSVFFLLWLVSKNYLYYLPILESVFWIIWLVLSILFFPFVIGISTYILKKQAEALMENDYIQQGYTREEARDMSKKSRRR